MQATRLLYSIWLGLETFWPKSGRTEKSFLETGAERFAKCLHKEYLHLECSYEMGFYMRCALACEFGWWLRWLSWSEIVHPHSNTFLSRKSPGSLIFFELFYLPTMKIWDFYVAGIYHIFSLLKCSSSRSRMSFKVRSTTSNAKYSVPRRSSEYAGRSAWRGACTEI